MKKVIKINESDLKSIIGEAIIEVNNDYDQWKHEARLFMAGLRSGNVVVDGDTAYVQIFKRWTASNDPRYVYIRKGDRRLHDDHYYIQDSPVLGKKTLNVIYNRLGWNNDNEIY